MPKRTNIKWTTNLDIIRKTIDSESMLTYIDDHRNSEYVLIHKYLTHSDLISSGKRSEKQGLDHNLLNYLSIPTMEKMKEAGLHFESAHQSCISLPKIFTEKLGFKERSQTGGTIQYNLENFANIFLVNDTLDYFSPKFTKQVFDVLGKEYYKKDKWEFSELDLSGGDFTKIELTWAAHGIGTQRDKEFHKLRKNMFRTDSLFVLIETSLTEKNVFLMLSKNPKFFTVLGIRNDTWLRITELKLNRLMREITKVDNVGITEDKKESKKVTRAKQSAWRKQLAEEMMNYTVHDNEVFCPLTGIVVNFTDAGTLLRASHIKAYKDSNELEKYDINNGILMCANADALFDKHLFTIGSDGELIFSKLIEGDHKLLNDLLLSKPIFKEILNPQRLKYLEEHRKVFNEKEKIRLSGNIDLGDSEEVITDYLDDNEG